MHVDSVYLASLVYCLIQVLRTGTWRRYPLFTVSTAAAAIFEAAYQPYSPEWLKSCFALLVTPLMALRALAVAEAFVRSSAGFRQRKLVAAAALCFALLFAAIVAWRFNAVDVLHSAIQARRVVVVALSAFLGVYMLLMWSVGYKRSGLADSHVLLMFLSCAVMSSSAVLRMAFPFGIWEALATSSYAASALVYLTWGTVIAFRELPPVPQVLNAPCSAD